MTMALTLGSVAPVLAQDDDALPGAPRLLPEDTLAYIRLDDANDFRDDLSNSSVGRMLNDPEVKPFASEVYQTAAGFFDQFAAAVGISMDEILAIPSGQVAIALMPSNLSDRDEEAAKDDEDKDSEEAIRRRLQRMRRNQNGFSGVIMIDAGSNADDLMGLIERLEERATSDGYVRRTSTIDGTELVQLLPPRQGPPEVEYFSRSGTIVFGIGHKTAAKVLDQWLDRSEESSLADRADFSSVMTRCVGAEGTRPQFTFFIDPYSIVRRIVNRNAMAAMAMTMVDNLGVNKIRGIGGSSFRGGEVFEAVSHLHILVDPPRDGIFGVLRPETGDSTPPDWVPNDVTSYTTLYWDFETTFDNIGKIFETISGPGSFEPTVLAPMKTQTGIDLREELITNMAGRYVSLRWIEPPVKINSATQLHAVQMKDPVLAKQVLAKVKDRFPNAMQTESISGYVAYVTPAPQNLPQGLRQPQYCVMMMDDWVIFSDSKAFLERVAQANRNARPRLVTVPEYELVSSELGGKLDGEKPFMVSFLRSSEYIRQLYELVSSPDTRRFVRSAGQNNPIAGQIATMLEKNELPPFEKLEKYFAPSGTFAYDEPSGMHIGSFTLRADD